MKRLLTVMGTLLFLLVGVGLASGELIVNQDGTITQTKKDGSQLMWIRNVIYINTSGVANGLTFPEMTEFAHNLEYAGYDNWRLPTVSEMDSLIIEDYALQEAQAFYHWTQPPVDPVLTDIYWTSMLTVHGEPYAYYAQYADQNGISGAKSFSAETILHSLIVRELPIDSAGN